MSSVSNADTSSGVTEKQCNAFFHTYKAGVFHPYRQALRPANCTNGKMPQYAGYKRPRSQSLPSTQFTQSQSSMGGMRRTYKRSAVAALAARTPTFTETYEAGVITAGTGGLFTGRMADITEITDYQALYRSYKVLKAEIIVLPDTNSAAVSVGNAGIGQLIYAVDPSAELVAPGNAVDCLKNNKVRMTNLDKPLRIRFKPVASTTVGILGGGTVGITQKEPWLSLDDGLPILHNGVSWWYQNTSAGANNTVRILLSFGLLVGLRSRKNVLHARALVPPPSRIVCSCAAHRPRRDSGMARSEQQRQHRVRLQRARDDPHGPPLCRPDPRALPPVQRRPAKVDRGG